MNLRSWWDSWWDWFLTTLMAAVVVWFSVQFSTAGPESTPKEFSSPESIAAQNLINRQNYDLGNKALNTRLQYTTRLIAGSTSVVTSQRVEAGAVALDNSSGGAVVEISGGVNFLESFTTAPLVWCEYVGTSFGASNGYPPNNAFSRRLAFPVRITKSSFSAILDDSAGSATIANGERNWVVWQAWGR